jgi:pSer/pThr/pTyr-binding forkhead associated (FHA) protein
MSDRKQSSAYLVYRIGDDPERIVIWDTIDIRVGRRKSQDIVVPDAEVSREHSVFLKDGDRFVVKDLGTGLGTLRNGERVSECELQPGDVIQIGPMEVRFGCTTHSIRPGGNTRFASQLKGGLQVPARPGAGGRTMLGFDPEDSLASAAPTTPPPELNVARAVTADGTLEELDDDDPLGLTDQEAFVAAGAAVRDLDRELGTDRDSAASASATPSPLRLRPLDGTAPEAQAPLEIELELEGQTPQIASLLAALRGKLIGVPALKIKLRKSPGR